MPSPETTSVTNTLIGLAAELQQRVLQYAEWRQRDTDMLGLTTRREELRRLVERAISLARAVTLLEEELDLSAVKFRGVSQLRQKASEIAKRFADDPASLTKP